MLHLQLQTFSCRLNTVVPEHARLWLLRHEATTLLSLVTVYTHDIPSVNPDNGEPAQTCSHSGTILVAMVGKFFAHASHTHILIT